MSPPLTRAEKRRRNRQSLTSGTSSSISQSTSTTTTPPRKTPSPVNSPGPHQASVLRLHRQQSATPASPTTVRKVSALRKQLFQPRGQSAVPTANYDPRLGEGGSHQQPAMVNTPPGSRHASRSPPRQERRSRSRGRSTSRRRHPSPPDLQQVLTQMATAITQMATHQQAAVPPAPPLLPPAPAAPAEPPPPPPNPAFNYAALASEGPTSHRPMTEGELQRVLTALHARLPQLQGRDAHETRFVLNVASAYPNLTPAVQQAVSLRANLLYIATHHGWNNAIAATQAANPTIGLYPPGFQLQPPRRRPLPTYQQQPQTQQPMPQQAPQQQQRQYRQPPQRGRGRGRQ